MRLHAPMAAIAWFLIGGCNGDSHPVHSTPPPQVLAADALRVPWTFTIQNQDHQTIGTLTVRFTDEPAKSCISGNWKRLAVVAFESTGEPAFPGHDPLSYEVDKGKLTIGRNEICDGYVMLDGELTDKGLTGAYYSLGLGGTKGLGYVRGVPIH